MLQPCSNFESKVDIQVFEVFCVGIAGVLTTVFMITVSYISQPVVRASSNLLSGKTSDHDAHCSCLFRLRWPMLMVRLLGGSSLHRLSP